jgi:hypothetical protein
MFALVQQTFLAKKPCKKSADLRPRQGNLQQGTFLQNLTKPRLATQK